MSTRAQIRFATREAGQSFSEHPSAIHAQFYKHSDGYPEGLGMDIANSIYNGLVVNYWEIEELDARHGDLEYIYSRSSRIVSIWSISQFFILVESNIDSAMSTPKPSG